MIRFSRIALFSLVVVFSVALVLPAQAQMRFGGAVAIAGGDVLVGEPGNLFSPGFVYVYRSANGSWEEVLELSASDAAEADGFGAAIATEGDLLAVGATDTGAVYLFSREGGEWTEVARLSPDDLGDGDRFGSSVALGKDVVAIGAPMHSDAWGAVYVYRRGENGWAMVDKLVPPMPEMDEGEDGEAEVANDEREPMAEVAGEAAEEASEAEEEEAPEGVRFGSLVRIYGDWIVVGAPRAENRAGHVYAFLAGDDAIELVRTLGEGGDENDGFGASVAVDPETMEMFIGAPGADRIGRVDVFTVDEETDEVNLSRSLRAFDGTRGAAFGTDIAFGGDRVLVAAPRADGFQGRIYSFARDADGTWTGVDKIGTSNIRGFGGFAGAMAASSDLIVAGIPGDDFGAGTAMIMERGLGGWDRTKVLSDVRSLDPITGTRVECADGMVGRFPCESVDLISYLPMPDIGSGRGGITNDIWGWTDPETRRDYALIGITDRTSFVDVTDPYNPALVGTLMMTDGARGSVWRDIKVHADHAFIVADAAAEHGVQIFDLTRLRDYTGAPITFTEDAHYDQVASAHNIVINEETAFAFVVGASGGGETCGGGLHMINIEDPKNPIFAGCFADTRTGRRGTGYSHDAQCVTYEGPDDRYANREICIGSNETAISIADVTDKRNPVAVGMASYPNVAYSHQGWLTEDHRFFYMNDEGDEASGLVDGTRTIIWDVQDLEDPIVVGEYISDNPAMDHNLYVVGDVMYQSNYDSGLRVFDVSDPENMRPIGFFDTQPYGTDGSGGGGSWSNYPYFSSGVVVVTSMNEGLFVVKLRDEAMPTGGVGSE